MIYNFVLRQLQKILLTVLNSTLSSFSRLPAWEPHDQSCRNTSWNMSYPYSKSPHDIPVPKSFNWHSMSFPTWVPILTKLVHLADLEQILPTPALLCHSGLALALQVVSLLIYTLPSPHHLISKQAFNTHSNSVLPKSSLDHPNSS